jgi:hypothetical protein
MGMNRYSAIISFGALAALLIPKSANSDTLAVWRPSDGTWYIIPQNVGQWGQGGDIPVPTDYDSDGKDDIAVWRPSDGTWYIINSSNGAVRTQQWGQGGDIPVPVSR